MDIVENWKPVEGYRNYEVSNTGKVRTKDYNHTGLGKELKLIVNSRGYLKCNLMENGIRKNVLVHRMVATAFIPNDDVTKTTVNHIDGNKENNHVSNLEWLSVKDNVIHAHETGLIKYAHGENHYKAILPTTEVLSIKRMLNGGVKGRDIAKLFDVDEKYISSIKTKHSRKYELV